MSRRQATAVIALLAVIAVLLIAGLIYLFSAGGDTQQSRSDSAAMSSAPSADPEPSEVDPAALLEGVGLDVVEHPPVPDAPESWGHYVLDGSWDGQVRVFEGSGLEPIRGEDGQQFPASMNACGTQTYLVTFRSVAEPVLLEAQLINAVGDPADSEVLNGGWMLGTNCVTPSFAFHSSTGDGTLTDVAYTVHRYSQSSAASDEVAQQPQVATSTPVPAPAPVAPAEPTFVRCVTGLASKGIYSDGSTRRDTRCPEPQVLEGERVCGGMGGWREVSRERYIELCGVEPPTGG